ncbi:MAG: hypothetical protein Q7S27_02505 [Nanoarchaeota archaeon]|nr:hypothetical protein [Nanoarchaeota archaeon]
MGEITIDIPEDLKENLRKANIDISVLIKMIAKKLLEEIKIQQDLQRAKEIVSKSKFTDKNAEELSNKIKASMLKTLKEKGII